MSFARIAVIGAHGQIGAQLVKTIGAKALAVPRAQLDLSQLDSIIPTLTTLAPDAIINAAAYTNVERAEDEAALAHLVNAGAPAAMAEYATRSAIPLIHISTDYVFDGTKPSPYVEDDIPCPINVYGKSKAEGERAVMAANPHAIIVRTSWVNSADSGNFIAAIAKKARSEKHLRVVADQIGAPSFANDIAQGIAQILMWIENDNPPKGIFHMTNAGFISWHGLATALVEQMRLYEPLPCEHIEAIASTEFATRAQRPHNSRLDCAKLRQVFDVSIRPWQDALKETVGQWYASS